MPHHLILLGVIIQIKFGEDYMELLIMKFLHPPVTSSLLNKRFVY
jgi:hypothetical protein